MNRAQNLVLIKPRADGLPDFGQKLVFLGAPLRVVHDDVVLKRQADLQRQPDQQPQIRRTKHLALSMRKQDDAKIVFPGLQADGGQIPDVFVGKDFLELLKTRTRKSRQRFLQFSHLAEGNKTAAPVSQF